MTPSTSSFDKIEESMENDQESKESPSATREQRDQIREQRAQNILKGLGMSGEPVPVADSYSFNQLIEMRVESFNKSGKKK